MKIKFDLQGPSAKSAAEITKKLQKEGYEAVLAGGAVRDLLIGRQPKDYDVATIAVPNEVLKCFKRTQKVGAAFGVVLVHDYGEAVEVATFRTDGNYSDGRRPDDVTFTDAKTDASRRDFTVNGLFYDLEKEEVVDYVGGLQDLEAKIIRAIGEADRRFSEDYLRMLRAIRFAVSLNFAIEEDTAVSLKKNAHLIDGIAKDRIHNELHSIFLKGNSDRALWLLKSLGLLEPIFGDIHSEFIQEVERPHLEGGELPAVFAILFSELSGKESERRCEALRCSNHEKKEVLALIKAITSFQKYPELGIANKKKMLRKLDVSKVLFILKRLNFDQKLIDEIDGDRKKWSDEDLNPKLFITGDDLISAGYKPGPVLGKCLVRLENLTLESKIQSKDEAWEMLKTDPELQQILK